MTDGLFHLEREPAVLAPGAVHVPDWLDRRQQEYLLRACREWTARVAPQRVALPGGGEMSVRTLSLGRRWSPYRYADGPDVPPIPEWLGRAARSAVATATAIDPRVTEYDGLRRDPRTYTPDVGLVNFYGRQSRMGMHRDIDEQHDDPVVSLSLGDSCVFRFGNTAGRGRPYEDVRLESGDLVVFGGPARFAFHGVPSVTDGSAPGWCSDVVGAEPGRINITLRRSRADG